MTNLAIREPTRADGRAAPDAAIDGRTRWWFPVVAFLLIGAVLWCVATFAGTHLSRDWLYPQRPFTGGAWFESWARWDGFWYRSIVRDGYVYYPGVQSSVAFFPAYPVAMWLLSGLFPSIFVTGTVLTVTSGLAVSVLFYRWCAARMSATAAAIATLTLLLYPYAWYLYGAVYADAFCLAAMLLAFVAVERDHLWLAGLAGFVASAARPVGLVVAVALVLRVLELRNAPPVGAEPIVSTQLGRLARFRTEVRRRFAWRGFRWADAPVLLSFGGFVAWCGYLWVRFGDPFLFSTIQKAPGWEQPDGPATWFKARLFGEIFTHPDIYTVGKVLQGAAAVGIVLLVPRIARRFGWAYAALTLGAVLLPLVGTKDFIGTGRYLLAAFPAFAFVGEWLATRVGVRARALILGASGAMLVFMTAQFARGFYLS